MRPTHRRDALKAGLAAAGALTLAPGSTSADDGTSKHDKAVAELKSRLMAMGSAPIATATVAPGLFLLTGPGGNVAALAGGDGTILVDSGLPGRGGDFASAAATAGGGRPVKTLINTHWHLDHAGGNAGVAAAGAVIVAHDNARARLSTDQYNDVFQMASPAAPKAALPAWTIDHEATLHLNGEEIHLFAVPPAHTDGDLVVHFRKADVIHAGDLVNLGGYPNIDANSDGWIGGMVAAVDQILKVVGPRTKVIPGHGPVGDRAEVVKYRGMLAGIHEAVAPLVAAGKTVDEAIDAKPTRAFDDAFGRGFFDGAMFTRIVYAGLARRRNKA